MNTKRLPLGQVLAIVAPVMICLYLVVRASSTSASDLAAVAGEYYYGDGLGTNITLQIRPDATYSCRWIGCLGEYDRDRGTVLLEGNSLRLDSASEARDNEALAMETDYLAVSWGERSYLISKSQVAQFCDAVNSGREPREGPHGSHLLRAGDETKAVVGWPELPRSHRTCLLDRPTVAQH